MKTRVAVHFNFKANKLSVRAIRADGTLGRLIALRDEVLLQNCDFTVNAKRLNAWRRGNKHARQFAEVRGFIADAPLKTPGEPRMVSFEPKARDDFFDAATGMTVIKADYVFISGREMTAFGANKNAKKK